MSSEQFSRFLDWRAHRQVTHQGRTLAYRVRTSLERADGPWFEGTTWLGREFPTLGRGSFLEREQTLGEGSFPWVVECAMNFAVQALDTRGILLRPECVQVEYLQLGSESNRRLTAPTHETTNVHAQIAYTASYLGR